MSSHFSPGSGELTSDLNGPECQSSDSASSTENAGLSLNGIGPEFHSRKMSEPSTLTGAEQMELTQSSGGGTKAPAVVTGPKKYQPLRKLTEAQVEEAIRMYQSGLSLAKCAEPFGVSRQSMHDLLKRRIKLRDRLEALPRLTDEERSKVQEKRNRAIRRYRSRAKRITRAQLDAVKERDQVCVKCGEPGVDVDHIVPVMKGGQTEMSNLQFLCKLCHIEKSRNDWKGVSRKEATQSTSFAEASHNHAKTSPSPGNEPDSTANAPASSSKQPESLTLFSDPEGGSSLRTFPDFFPATAAGISESFSRRWPNSGFTTSPGECWTADTSECPSDGAASSSLPDVLEATVPDRFYLSPKAAAGILRRALKRGRELPKHLHAALTALASRHRDDDRKMTRTLSPEPSGTGPGSEDGK